jgi:hypothetical protein
MPGDTTASHTRLTAHRTRGAANPVKKPPDAPTVRDGRPAGLLKSASYNEHMTREGQHVVPAKGKWVVRKAGSARSTATFDTQQEAVERARKIAKNQKTELYIHGRDGRIRKRDSYGSDPHPPKG